MTVKRIFLFFIISVIPLSFYGKAVYAQLPERERVARFYPEDLWQESVDDLRWYVNGLVQENQRLTAAKVALEQRLSELEGTLPELPVKPECPTCEDKGCNQSLKKEIESLKKDKLSLQNEIATLKKQDQRRKIVPRSGSDDKLIKTERLLKNCEQDNVALKRELSEAQGEVIEQQNDRATLAQSKAENARFAGQLENLKDELGLKIQEIENLKKENTAAARQQEIAEALLQIQLKRSAAPTAAEGFGAAAKTSHEAAGYDFAVRGKYVEALVEYQKSLEENPNNKDIYFNLGSV